MLRRYICFSVFSDEVSRFFIQRGDIINCMKYETICKTLYALYTIPVQIVAKLIGVRMPYHVYFAGFPFIVKKRNTTIEIGKHCRFMSWKAGNLIGINHRCLISTSTSGAILRIGNSCSFSGVSIWCFDKIEIGNHVRVGANVLIIDGDAHQDDPRAGKNSPIYIEDNVWIGANVTILKGVHIGRNTLIGAGSVVTSTIPANTIAAGNPCKVIRQLDEQVIRQLESK